MLNAWPEELVKFHEQFHDCFGRIEQHPLGLNLPLWPDEQSACQVRQNPSLSHSWDKTTFAPCNGL